MRARGLLMTGLLVASTGSACDWRDFDSLQKSTPVLAVEAPSGYPSGGDFAQLLAATSPPTDGSAAARFVTSGLLQTAVTVVTLSPAGAPSGHLVAARRWTAWAACRSRRWRQFLGPTKRCWPRRAPAAAPS